MIKKEIHEIIYECDVCGKEINGWTFRLKDLEINAVHNDDEWKWSKCLGGKDFCSIKCFMKLISAFIRDDEFHIATQLYHDEKRIEDWK